MAPAALPYVSALPEILLKSALHRIAPLPTELEKVRRFTKVTCSHCFVTVGVSIILRSLPSAARAVLCVRCVVWRKGKAMFYNYNQTTGKVQVSEGVLRAQVKFDVAALLCSK